MVVTVSHLGYVKRNRATEYRAQRRGGKGLRGMETRDEDFVARLFVASTHAYVLFFTNRGRVHWKKVWELPLLGRAAKGRSLANLLTLGEGERVQATLPVRSFDEAGYVVLCTRKGVIKKTDLAAFSNPRRVRHHRDQPRRRRRADRRGAHHRHAADPDRDAQRQVGALRGDRRAPDGPQRDGRARRLAGRRRPRRRHGDPVARRDGAVGHRERFRQAHAARGLPAPEARRHGHHHDPHQRAERSGDRRRAGAPTKPS